jgi:hypothetical protein
MARGRSLARYTGAKLGKETASQSADSRMLEQFPGTRIPFKGFLPDVLGIFDPRAKCAVSGSAEPVGKKRALRLGNP